MTELEKWENCKKERSLIKNFLKYANEHGFYLKEDNTLFTNTIGYRQMINSLILSYFNIDSYQLDKEGARTMSEVKGYAVRITQNNDLDKVCNESYVDLVKKYNGALISPDSQTIGERVNFLGTFVFLKKEEAEGFFRETSDLGIEAYWEKNRPIVDDNYFKGGYK